MNDSPVSLFCLVAYSAICVDLHKTVKEKKRKKKRCVVKRELIIPFNGLQFS